jgi:hypothetical protein
MVALTASICPNSLLRPEFAQHVEHLQDCHRDHEYIEFIDPQANVG